MSPWAEWVPATIEYCEAPLAGWIRTPANTWSNLCYAVAGVWIWRQKPPQLLRAFVPAALYLTLASGLFHASGTFVFQVLDNTAMFVVPGLLLGLCGARLNWVRAGRAHAVAAAVVAIFTLLMLGLSYTPVPTQTAMGLLVILLLALEWRARRPEVDYRWLGAAFALLALSFAIWILDAKRILCAPDNHWLQGHAFWHLGTALCFTAVYRYGRQFAAAGTPGSDKSSR